MKTEFLSKEIEEVEKNIKVIQKDLIRIDDLESRDDSDNYNIPDREEWKNKLELNKAKLQTLKLAQVEEKKKHNNFVEKLNGIIDGWYIQNIKSAIRIDKEIIILKKEIDKLLEEME